MSFAASDGRESFGLAGNASAIVLDDEGIHHPRGMRGGAPVFTPYAEITHLASSDRSVWLGTRRSVYVFARAAFDDLHGGDRLVRSLLARVSELPGGSRQLERMAGVEELMRDAAPLRATWVAVAACLLVFVLQLIVGDPVYEVGYFSSVLVNDGDLWRIVTANLLHAAPRFPLHLALNLAGLIFLGTLIERPLGAWRTTWVMGVSGAGAMLASGLAGYAAVIGISGVVFGLAGGLAWLEFRCADALPAPWRIPRRTLLTLLILNAALMVVVPLIAGAAHVGGFAAGWLATSLVGHSALARRRPALWLRAAATAVLVLSLWSLGAAAGQLFGEPDFTARHARRLATLPGVSPVELNDRAWMIAISNDPTRAQLDAALALAERAVLETRHGEPNILDTLAEVQFQLGQQERAIASIDEAIALDPEQPYFREQRRRFTGERDADDRPEYVPWQTTPAPQSPPPRQLDPGRQARRSGSQLVAVVRDDDAAAEVLAHQPGEL